MVDLAEQLGYAPIITLDDKSVGFELSTFYSYIDSNTEFIVALGNNQLRLSWCNRIVDFGGILATLIHSSAYVSPKAKVMEGCVVLPIVKGENRISSQGKIEAGLVVGRGVMN